MSELAISLSRVSHGTFQTVFLRIQSNVELDTLPSIIYPGTRTEDWKFCIYQTHLIIHCCLKIFDPNYIYNFTWIF